MHDPILYTSDHRQAALQLRASTGSFWLPQREMASSTQNISLTSGKILDAGELSAATAAQCPE